MSTPAYFCTICENAEKDRINGALRAGTSLRQIAQVFAVGRTALTRHAGRCTTALETRKYRAAAKGGRSGAGTGGAGILRDDAGKLQPILSPEDVVEDLQKLRIGGWTLFAAAIKRSDWKSAERLLPQLLGILERFGELHKILGVKGVTVNIDARQQKVVQLYDSLPVDVLRRLRAGEVTLEQISRALEVASW